MPPTQLFAWPPAPLLLVSSGLVIGACIALAYWQLVVAEGVYLGPRVVRWLYDRVARRYDGIKCFDAVAEMLFVGLPLARALHHIPAPLVLDVACGTGRLPKALLGQPEFIGKIIGLDASRVMLAQAAPPLRDRVTLNWQNAQELPFNDATFDCVTCLEAVEFMPNTAHALTEMARVLRPGGLLLISNRIGTWAKWMPGHTLPTAAFEQLLQRTGFVRTKKQSWQVEYDLVWAVRAGHSTGGGVRPLPSILRCPQCRQPVYRNAEAWQCDPCARVFPIAPDGVIEMLAKIAAQKQNLHAEQSTR
jgi:ubiquinone/menaquinone biosynthesis C-methylase UbiE